MAQLEFLETVTIEASYKNVSKYEANKCALFK